MIITKAGILLLWTGLVAPAPPFIPDTTTSTTTTTTTTTSSTTTTTTTTPTTTFPTTTTTTTTATTTTATTAGPLKTLGTTSVPLRSTRKPGEFFSLRIPGDERRAVLQKLGPVDINHLDKLDLKPRQRLAITQELEYQQLGLPSFSDPSPWQRLSRDEQLEFNRKYLALPRELQEYSRNQFLSLPEARQEKAYQTFLTVDIQTLSRAIAREFRRERRVLERQTEGERERNHQEILRRLRQKKLQYSAMKVDNNVMMNHILEPEEDEDEVEMTTVENFISILKQQLSSSLQVVSNSEEETETVTTQLPVTWLAEQPRSLGVARTERLHSRGQAAARAPKSNSSILTARASQGRKFLSKSANSISEREKRLNIQRLMYDPRKKSLGRANRGTKF